MKLLLHQFEMMDDAMADILRRKSDANGSGSVLGYGDRRG